MHSDLDEETREVTGTVMAASRLLMALSARALASVDAGLTLPQLRTLVVLDRCGPVKLAALAKTLEVNASTALRMVDRLAAGGLVDRQVNPANRREVVLRLTEAGSDLVTQVLDHRHREVASLVGRLPESVREGLVAGLRALTEAADDLAVGPEQPPGTKTTETAETTDRTERVKRAERPERADTDVPTSVAGF